MKTFKHNFMTFFFVGVVGFRVARQILPAMLTTLSVTQKQSTNPGTLLESDGATLDMVGGTHYQYSAGAIAWSASKVSVLQYVMGSIKIIANKSVKFRLYFIVFSSTKMAVSLEP